MKTCFKCHQSKPLSEFYRHSRMADGTLNKCKDCTREDVFRHRRGNIEKLKKYDRQRGILPHRLARNREYQRTIEGKVAHAEANKTWRARYPYKRIAQQEVQRAIRDGKMNRMPCERCGSEKTEAHHEDYLKLLEVNWLCPRHHKARHKELRRIFFDKSAY